MKIPPSRAERFVAKPEPAIRAVLVYGPDAGLVRERAERLCRGVVPEPTDPFRVAELSPANLRDDPARLADEAAQVSMLGGRRVVWVRDAVDGLAPVFESFLDEPVGDALVIVEAGDLASRSKLRALFESAGLAAALACYADTDESIAAVAREMLGQAGLTIAPDALDYLVGNLGSDRLLTRRELEKLILYAGAAGAQIKLEDVEACTGNSAGHSIDDAVLAAADGDARGVARALARAFLEGETAVAIVRAAERYFQRLHLAAGQVERGEIAERVVDGLRPKLFWKIRSRFLAQLRFWSSARAARALDRLTAAEIACKSTGMPDEAIAMRCLLELSGAAGREKKRG